MDRAKIEKEAARLVKPFPWEALRATLDGEPSLFDVDGQWHSHHHGRPRPLRRDTPCFSGEAMLAAAQACAYLAMVLPPDDRWRAALPALFERVHARMRNPELLCYAGFWERKQKIGGEKYVPPGFEKYPHHHGADNGVLVSCHGYLYFRPARLAAVADEAERARHVGFIETVRRRERGDRYGAFLALRSEGLARLLSSAARAEGGYHADPRVSVPELVEGVATQLSLGRDAATLYLQLLALVDCTDPWLRTVNGWKSAQLKRAAGELVAAGLAREEAMPRAGRKVVLPGPWETGAPPDPASERFKLALYEAEILPSGDVFSPLSRLLPLRPLAELFAQAWALVARGEGPDAELALDRSEAQWIDEIRAAPDDDTPRIVYADRLTEGGDPRGEMIALQCRRARLERGEALDGVEDPAGELARVKAREAELLEQYGGAWSAAVHPYIVRFLMARGFIDQITVRMPAFHKHAAKVVAALPLLRALELEHNTGVGPIPAKHIELLASCDALGSCIERLDFTADQYLANVESLARLLEAPFIGRLRWLRIGAHRRGRGVGLDGAAMIADCERLGELRHLDLGGQRLGMRGSKRLVSSPHLGKLEVLRLPFNNIKVGAARSLLAALEEGALPALRRLELADEIESPWGVPSDVAYQANEIPRALVAHIEAVLKARG
ncbi:MAG: TIGR02996 domain-containing protein [Myxococcales bacterium]|nr:TIGR02996 domain-containing protein [Myxococcales bacterium]